MQDRSDLHKLHEHVTNMITEEREEEMRALKAEKEKRAERLQGRDQNESLRAAGLDVDALESLHRKRVEEAEKDIETVEARMVKESDAAQRNLRLDVSETFLPKGSKLLTPSWTAGFTEDEGGGGDSLSSASDVSSQAVLGGGACKNYYNWAKGGGWGCTGGTASNQTWVEFGFWFKPSVSKFYSIRPMFRYRGFYIVRADDEWYNCKNARVKVSQWVNVHQYNWKGWTNETVLNVSGDNINRNRRFDDDRHMYSSYLLGGGDWAFIRCTVGLYVRAKGGGSYAKNDFSTGNANYLCVPHCHVT